MIPEFQQACNIIDYAIGATPMGNTCEEHFTAYKRLADGIALALAAAKQSIQQESVQAVKVHMRTKC